MELTETTITKVLDELEEKKEEEKSKNYKINWNEITKILIIFNIY